VLTLSRDTCFGGSIECLTATYSYDSGVRKAIFAFADFFFELKPNIDFFRVQFSFRWTDFPSVLFLHTFFVSYLVIAFLERRVPPSRNGEGYDIVRRSFLKNTMHTRIERKICCGGRTLR